MKLPVEGSAMKPIRILSIALFLASTLAQADFADFKEFEQRAVGGHSIRVLPDGKTLTEARQQAIESARESIYLSAYSFQDDAAALDIAERLCAKARDHLDVRVFLDHRGSNDFGKIADHLRDCGARVFNYDALDWGIGFFRETLHEKLLIVDGLRVITGGSGYSDKYATASHDSPTWHDLDALIEGPAACWYHFRFQNEWRKSSLIDIQPDRKIYQDEYGQKILERKYGLGSFRPCKYVNAGTAHVYPIQSNPLLDGGHWLLDTHIKGIHASQGTIRLYSPYFTPHKDLIAALLDARKRGVKVTILTNAPWSNDEQTSFVGTLRIAGPLLDAGVEIRMWKKQSTLHRKGGVYDGKWAWVGSDNLDRAAHVYNSEDIALTDDVDTVRELNAQFDEDLADSIPLTREFMRVQSEHYSRFRKWFVGAISRWL
jgi:cardiolipin synthase